MSLALGPQSSAYLPTVNAAADKYGIPRSILVGLVQRESKFDASARGKSGEIGLMQIMPATAKGLGINPYDINQNIYGGAKYLSQQYDKYGNWRDALSSYNSGYPANKSSAGASYAGSVLGNAQALGYPTGTIGGSTADATGVNVPWYQPLLDVIGSIADAPVSSKSQNAANIGTTVSDTTSVASNWLTSFNNWLRAGAVNIVVALAAFALIMFGIYQLFKTQINTVVKTGAKVATIAAF